MSDIVVNVGKSGGMAGTLVRGDNNTTAVRVIIPRRAGNVDLAQLQWSVALRNAAGAEDVVDVEAVEVQERVISFVWHPGGIATEVTGDTQFDVAGMDGRSSVWGSAPYTLHIMDNLGIERAVVDVTEAVCGKVRCGETVCGKKE